jgi:hypothetical protein
VEAEGGIFFPRGKFPAARHRQAGFARREVARPKVFNHGCKRSVALIEKKGNWQFTEKLKAISVKPALASLFPAGRLKPELQRGQNIRIRDANKLAKCAIEWQVAGILCEL